MSKQPYIPLYVGDYLKDTRILPLAARGGWVDLILYMWESPVRGQLEGSIEDYARLMNCDVKEANFVLDLLEQKRIADFDKSPTGVIKIVSRKMRRDAEISKIRSEAGKKSVESKFAKGFVGTKQSTKIKQNTESDIEIETDNVIPLKTGPTFDEFWDKYDKKVDKMKSERKWARLSTAIQNKIMLHLDVYIPLTPDPQFRKSPLTYLTSHSWEDEVPKPKTAEPPRASKSTNLFNG